VMEDSTCQPCSRRSVDHRLQGGSIRDVTVDAILARGPLLWRPWECGNMMET
jgi:hypothetical protein